MQVLLKIIFRECRDGSDVKNAGCSSRSEFDSHNPCGCSQLSITPVSGALIPLFWSPWAPGRHTVHRHTWRGNTLNIKISK